MVHRRIMFLVLFNAPGSGAGWESPSGAPMTTTKLLSALLATTTLLLASTTSAHAPTEMVTPNFSHAITNIPGKSLVAVEVLYPPGAASAPHSHAKSAFIYAYVVSGAIESQVDNEPARIYTAGQ